ncbi:phosphatase PAP2 family protein [Bacillus sp. B-jedd]|uniref:phosphatase PAP2 family protein n=1 Tax=Bacillus sp. B-jedd TaxID=1476857 RepID=UPI000662BCF5|nr:phosphatase PAP2 family protein [Bacillus sp. B-jedd]
MKKKLMKVAFSYIGLAGIVLFLFLYAFVEIAEELRENELEIFDSHIIVYIQGNISPHLTKLMLFMTMLGSIPWVTGSVIALMALLIFLKKWRAGLFIGISSGVGSLFNIFLKSLFKRQRPDIEPLIVEQGFSFPSGHAMGSMIFYGAVAYLIFHFAKKGLMKFGGPVLFLLLILFVGISRIYLGVHFPSDIIGGFAAGGAWLTICIILFNFLEKRHEVKEG